MVYTDEGWEERKIDKMMVIIKKSPHRVDLVAIKHTVSRSWITNQLTSHDRIECFGLIHTITSFCPFSLETGKINKNFNFLLIISAFFSGLF